MNKIEQSIANLEQFVTSDDFIGICSDVIEEIEGRDDAFVAVEPILRFMEKYPDADFGSPGPLVHFVERFYKHGYEEQLIESLKRQPTRHTLFMMNRISNDSGSVTT